MSNAAPQAPLARRRLVRWLGSLPLMPVIALLSPRFALAAPKPPLTPSDDLGPFYPPEWSGDLDTDLTHLGKEVAEGNRLSLGGTVTDTTGRPIVGALVEIWQADARGRYRHPGVDPRTRDAGFQGYGRTRTDAEGRYRFATIIPGNYGSRPPHIHFRIAPPSGRELVTQMYFRGNNREGNGYAPAEREALTVDLVGQEASGRISFAALFDLTLPGA